MAFDDKAYAREYYLKNKEKIKERTKQWRIDNPEQYASQNKKHYEENKEKILQLSKEDRTNNKEKYQEKDRKKYLKHKDKIIVRVTEYNKTSSLRPDYMSHYVKKRANEDIQYYMQRELRRGLYYAVKKNWIFKKKECALALDYLGCTVNEFRTYIESKFKEGMTWNNWGTKEGEWQLDHIKPLSAFDLTDLEQLAVICHYSNIQPIWVKENAKKGSKMPNGEPPKRQHIRKKRESFISTNM